MSDFTVALHDDRLRIDLRGDLDVDEAQAVHEAVARELEQAGSLAAVLIDLTSLTGCSIFARSALVKVQESLKVTRCRTAYVADVPRFRGLALWVINLAEDPAAKSCANQQAAEQWLAGDASRLDEIKGRTTRALAEQQGGSSS